MASIHEELEGDYLTAYSDVLEGGGQLYPGTGNDSPNVVVRGKLVRTYWKPNSRRRAETHDLARWMGVEPYAATGGRLARHLVENVLKLPYRTTFWNRRYKELAVKGEHWHYCMVAPNESCMGAEFDLKSAYFTSLAQGKTLLYHEGRGYVDDEGALEMLIELVPHLPKWFRLQLLGCLASWNMQFLTRSKKPGEEGILVQKKVFKISYGAAFNAVHRAILRNYKIMERVHEFGGEHIKRMHTDSFFLSWECPVETEQKIFDYLEKTGCRVDVKGSGRAYFFDLNCGFVGNKLVGSPTDVKENMKIRQIKYPSDYRPDEVVNRFKERQLQIDKMVEEYNSKIDGSYWGKQLVIPST